MRHPGRVWQGLGKQAEIGDAVIPKNPLPDLQMKIQVLGGQNLRLHGERDAKYDRTDGERERPVQSNATDHGSWLNRA